MGWTPWDGPLGRCTAGAGWTRCTRTDQAASTRRWEHSLATGEPFEAEYRLQMADGATWRWHLVRALPRRDAAGHIEHWYGTTTDIHELREARASLEAARADLEYRVQGTHRGTRARRGRSAPGGGGRRSSEAVAKRERDLSEKIINSLPGIFYLHDEDRRMLRWNRNFETVTGHTAEEVASLDTLEILREGDRDLVARSICWVFASGSGEVEATIVSTDGREHPYYLSGRRIELDGHNWLIGMGIDISARRQAEIERDRLFALSPDLFCILGQDGYFRQLNPSWERTLGYSVEELLERPYIDFLHPEDRSATERVRQQAEQGMPVHGFENRYRCRDGSWKWLSWNTTRDPVSGIIYGVARDVTSEKAVTEALSHSEERFRGLLESARDAIFTLSPEGILTSVNPTFEVLFGRPPEAFIGQPFQPFVHPEDVVRAEKLFETWLRGESLPAFELRLLAADGSAIPMELTLTALRVGEDVVGAVGIARDIRERSSGSRNDYAASRSSTPSAGSPRALPTTSTTC
ncbi:MAG: PAS domain S-box protein [Gammaproteobacteria bacterium]|nr:PAS domain S-box protein [Gammaproteobacteria bacterium]